MEIHRNDVFKIMVQCRLAFNERDQIIELLEKSTINEDVVEDDLFEAIAEKYKGTSNGYLSEVYEAITGEKVEIVGDVSELFECPCCKRKTLTEVYNADEGTGYDICDFCNWEDDGTTAIDVVSSVNKGSISEYRRRVQENFNHYYKEKWLSEKINL
jgi:DNA-binding ferritin-like protein (Dps family)